MTKFTLTAPDGSKREGLTLAEMGRAKLLAFGVSWHMVRRGDGSWILTACEGSPSPFPLVVLGVTEEEANTAVCEAVNEVGAWPPGYSVEQDEE